jgi:PBSX family phage terminase large subunit
MKQVMELLLEKPANTPDDWQLIADLGLRFDDIGDDNITNLLVVNAALLKKAKSGDVNAIKELRNIIQDDAYTKHKIKLEKEYLKLEKQKSAPPAINTNEYKGIPANMIAPAFAPVLFDIENHEHTEYVFPGGRGSTKSSFVSLQIIDLLMKNETMHACVMRQVADTLRGSVFQQILWAIEALGLNDEFRSTVSPMEVTRVSTGQKIFFRGADDPDKIKSIKVPFGYIGVLWFEELDQFAGPEAVRKIEQSAIRGGDIAYKFKSFNPPKSAQNWANKYIKIPRTDRLVTFSTFLGVPKAWLGKPFLDDAEFLKETNPSAYNNEYMGEANGVGGNVFDNVVIREVTDDEIKEFERLYRGVDWGWFPDPYAYNCMAYIASQHKLIIFDEYHCNKKSNRQTADELKNNHGVTANDLIICDSAEHKSTGDYRAFGLLARDAEKGPGSVEYSMKWLQSLREIVIDNVRCPHTAEEFLDYEYERDKDENIITGYPDKNNHHIDAVRYAMNKVWKRKGE